MPTAAPKTIYDAILKFQLDPPSLLKDTSGQVGPRKYKYVDLNQVVERVIRDRLNKMDCVVLQPLAGTEVQTVIRHVPSGTEITSSANLPDASTPQDMGKAITYLRRYSLVSLLSLIGDEDEDGAGFEPTPRASRKSPLGTQAEAAAALHDGNAEMFAPSL